MPWHFLFLSSGIFPLFVKWGQLGDWVLGPGLEREKEVGTSTREKVCLRLEWEDREREACQGDRVETGERKGLMEVRTEKGEGSESGVGREQAEG